ncbi:hypothetical protein SAMN02745117_01886 [Lampropedia hyalina DSM 16112]|jgi:hypothetical protein|uniref:Uncharacterized protein n=1 Tax=Lampropedia hyalina DSM 16112 TaxID=1122156 RepID=A0A1M5BDX1_9BURK|nr:hypothetical protein [Lampropedia hyalina]SHF40684.1 hypothetical protein SAMN02745117_01886 [Lampropedia hyalina DSM 16112]
MAIQLGRLSLVTIAAFAAIGAAQAQNLTIDFNSTQNIAGDTPAFRGSFTYEGVVYGPTNSPINGVANPTTGVSAPSASSINLETAFTGSANSLISTDENGIKLGNAGTYKYSDGTRGSNVVYRFYYQEYSAIAGNLTKGANHEQEERKHFVKAVVGQGSTLTALQALPEDSYTYNGIAFSNFPTGNFSYTVDLLTQTGAGLFTLDNILVPASWNGGTQGSLNVSGTLDSTSLIADANGIVGSAGIEGGSVTAGAQNPSDASQVALWNIVVANSTTTVDPKYYLNFFGTNSGTDVAREVAGTIIGLPERIGGVAIIGKR